MRQRFTNHTVPLLATLCVLFARSAECPGQSKPTPDHFACLTEAQTQEGSFGLVMACPAHDHGTPDEAAALLRQYRGKIGPDTPMSIWVCRAQQMKTLEQFAPLVDRIVVNPFIGGDENEVNGIKDAPWPEANHPILNRVRAIRQVVEDKELYACININGEGAAFKKRKPSPDEIRWLAYAVIGANYQGIVWRGIDPDQSVTHQLAALEEQITTIPCYGRQSQRLALTCAANNLFISSSRRGRHIVLVLLNPTYLTNFGSKGTILLPLERPVLQTEIVMPTTRPIKPDDVRALSGTLITSESDDNAIRLHFDVRGPGEVVILTFQDEVLPDIFNPEALQPISRDQHAGSGTPLE